MEADEIAARGLGADLTLVEARVLELGRAQLERPLAAVPLVVHGEAAVLRVYRPADAHDVQVPVAHPRHLVRPLRRMTPCLISRPRSLLSLYLTIHISLNIKY